MKNCAHSDEIILRLQVKNEITNAIMEIVLSIGGKGKRNNLRNKTHEANGECIF